MSTTVYSGTTGNSREQVNTTEQTMGRNGKVMVFSSRV